MGGEQPVRGRDVLLFAAAALAGLALVAILVLVVVRLAKVVAALVAVPSRERVTDHALAYRLVVVIVLP